MSRTAHTEPTESEAPKLTRQRIPWPAVAIVLGALALAATAFLSPESFETDAATGPMGAAVVDIPMERSGSTAVGTIEVIGSTIDMGDVPLDVTVIPTWTLTNTGSETVDLYEPHASVIEGCCPGPLQLGAVTLAPGASTELSFPLQMHPGMDGPHHFTVHVPLDPSGTDVLALDVIGDFHD